MFIYAGRFTADRLGRGEGITVAGGILLLPRRAGRHPALQEAAE